MHMHTYTYYIPIQTEGKIKQIEKCVSKTYCHDIIDFTNFLNLILFLIF